MVTAQLIQVAVFLAAAAIAALDVIEREPGYAALALTKAKAFARCAGLPEPASPIVPVLLGEAEAALKAAADKLLANTVIENYRVEVLG